MAFLFHKSSFIIPSKSRISFKIFLIYHCYILTFPNAHNSQTISKLSDHYGNDMQFNILFLYLSGLAGAQVHFLSLSTVVLFASALRSLDSSFLSFTIKIVHTFYKKRVQTPAGASCIKDCSPAKQQSK